jgi:hypothetical protein
VGTDFPVRVFKRLIEADQDWGAPQATLRLHLWPGGNMDTTRTKSYKLKEKKNWRNISKFTGSGPMYGFTYTVEARDNPMSWVRIVVMDDSRKPTKLTFWH